MTVGREVPEDSRRKAGEARQGARGRRGRPLPAEWQDPGWVRRRSGHTQEDARQVGAGQEARRAKARQGRGDAGAPQGGRAPQDGERVPKRSSRPPPREPSPGERMRLAGAKREGTPSGRCAGCRSCRDPIPATGRGAPPGPGARAPLLAEVGRTRLSFGRIWGARTIRSRPLGPDADTTLRGVRRRVREPAVRGARPSPTRGRRPGPT